MFNSYEVAHVKLHVESHKLSKRLLKILPVKERRTAKIAKLISNESLKFFESPVPFTAIGNTRKHKYMDSAAQSAAIYPGTLVTVTEMYRSYSEALDDMRG